MPAETEFKSNVLLYDRDLNARVISTYSIFDIFFYSILNFHDKESASHTTLLSLVGGGAASSKTKTPNSKPQTLNS